MGRMILFVAAIAVATAPTPAAAQAKPSVSKLPTVETFALANGLQVAVMRSDAAPVVAVQVWYHAGAKDEPRDRRGSAHMFEHMMFKGTQHVRAEAHAQFLNGIGGYVNAATDEDATHYINTVPADYLDFAVKLESERMRNLLFRPDMIAIEKEVVKEEIRQQENSPIAKGFLRFLDIAFTKHPYAWTAGGNIKDLDATTPEDLKTFYDAYYQPEQRDARRRRQDLGRRGQGVGREVVRRDPQGAPHRRGPRRARRSRRRPRSAARSSSPARSG